MSIEPELVLVWADPILGAVATRLKDRELEDAWLAPPLMLPPPPDEDTSGQQLSITFTFS